MLEIQMTPVKYALHSTEQAKTLAFNFEKLEFRICFVLRV